MKKYHIQFILICCLYFIFPITIFSQSRLILNGAKINIRNGASLVINNANTNALTRYNGFIISEGEKNIIKWCIGTTTGTYTVPLGYQTADYIPLTFTKTAGTGNGNFIFSSYHTGWNNSAYLPTGVLNVNYNGVDNSPFTIDRFWQIDAANYTIKPALSNLTFTYIDEEHTAVGNYIIENELGVQRWNPIINDWGDFTPGVNIDISTNKITVATVSSGNLYKWWTLPGLNGSHALPVELIDFKGQCKNDNVLLQWNTASEWNSKSFIVEGSTDGNTWIALATINGAGNSNGLKKYAFTDNTKEAERNYYRLKQVNNDETATYSSIIQVNCNPINESNDLRIYPNPSSGAFTIHSVKGNIISIMNTDGIIVYSEKCTDNDLIVNLSDMASGLYLVISTNATETSTAKLLIQH